MAAMAPQVWQWAWADNTLYGITATDNKGSVMPQPLIFMLNGLKLSKGGMFHPAKATLPAEGGTLYGITGTDVEQSPIQFPILFALKGMGQQRVFHPLPVPPETPCPSLTITGITRDAEGNPASGVTVYLFDTTTGTPVLMQTATSDGSGLYSFTVVQGSSYWVVGYRNGTPDKTGATLHTLTAGTTADVYEYDPTTIPDPTPVGSVLTNVSSGGQEVLISAKMTISI